MQIQINPAKWKEPIKAAMVEAITMAETALDVINNNGNDGLVKNMISSILDDNHPEDLEYAKSKSPPPFFFSWGAVWCQVQPVN